jgi:hypothetical protein
LAKHRLTWNDLPGLLAGPAPPAPEEQSDGNEDGNPPPPLDLIAHLVGRHCHLTEHQLTAITLWIAHSFLFERFSVTPRLALISPVRGCGKTTVINIINRLGSRPRKVDNVTGPSLFRMINRYRPTMLLDEADNQDLPSNPVLRAVLNSGHHRDGQIVRLDTIFYTFAPMAIAAIGRLPLPVMHRSVVIDMERSPSVLPRFDPHTIPDQQRDCDIVYRQVFDWAQKCAIDTDPQLPAELCHRPADNWRPLIAIADGCNAEWAERAREAAIALSDSQDDDLGVVLLSHIRDIFGQRERLRSAVIVHQLNELPDAPWSEWRGLRGDQLPRRLTQAQLAQLLSPFGIRPRTIWPARRGAIGGKSAKGFYRHQFEKAWAAYCGTPAQPTILRYLA